MNIRKEIENLAIWCIPALLLAALLSAVFSGYFEEIVKYGETSFGTSIMFWSFLGQGIGLVDNVVVAVWLYIQGKNESGRKVLWLLFGFVAHLFAAIIYIGLKIAEELKASSPNENK